MFIFKKKRMDTFEDSRSYGLRYDGKLASIALFMDYEFFSKKEYHLINGEGRVVDHHTFCNASLKKAKLLVKYPNFILFK